MSRNVIKTRSYHFSWSPALQRAAPVGRDTRRRTGVRGAGREAPVGRDLGAGLESGAPARCRTGVRGAGREAPVVRDTRRRTGVRRAGREAPVGHDTRCRTGVRRAGRAAPGSRDARCRTGWSPARRTALRGERFGEGGFFHPLRERKSRRPQPGAERRLRSEARSAERAGEGEPLRGVESLTRRRWMGFGSPSAGRPDYTSYSSARCMSNGSCLRFAGKRRNSAWQR